MTHKSSFTQYEVDKLRRLLKEKSTADREEQKNIRRAMRSLGFYITDFSQSYDGFTLADFETLVQRGLIAIVGPNVETEPARNPFQLGQIRGDTHIRDEEYIIDLCDQVLDEKSLRQHHFPFLCGDAGTPLPVDAYYPTLRLVIEYRERQHSERIDFFDKPDRLTVSGVHRGEQRRLYDQRRRDVLHQHGITLVELSYADFSYGTDKRLHRNGADDIKVIRNALAKWMKQTDR